MRRVWVAVAVAAALQVFGVGVASSGALLKAEGRLLRWEGPTRDGRTVITYHLLTSPYSVPGNKSILSPVNCAAMQPFKGIVAQSPSLSWDSVRSELKEALHAWESVANIAFVEVGDPKSANVVIGAQGIPEGKAFANLSYRSGANNSPVAKALGVTGSQSAAGSTDKDQNDGTAAIDQAYVCLNPKAQWKIGFDGNLEVYDLRYTLTHEIGHAIGLDHPDNWDALMASAYSERVHGLRPSDVAAVEKLYGAPRGK